MPNYQPSDYKLSPDITRTTLVQGFWGEKSTTIMLGTANRNGRWVFGLIHEGYMTHMCYGLDYFDPKTVLNEAKVKQELYPDDPGSYYFYFDVGNRVMITYTQMALAFADLELIPNQSEVWPWRYER